MTQRPYKMLLGLVLLLLVSLPLSAQEGLIVTVQQRLTLRTGPGTEWDRITVLPVGTAVALDGRNEDGQWVRGITERGQVGWMVFGALGLRLNQVLPLPVIARDAPITVSAPPSGAPPAPAAPSGGNLPAPVVAGSPVRGFSYGGHVASLNEGTVNAMRRAGMTWVKKQIRYFRGNNPNDFAGLIADAHSKGFRIMLGVVGLPSEVLGEGYFDEYAGFVAGLAALGADAIEVWNEPNIDREWPTGQVNGATYTQLLARAYNTIKGANRNTLVISGAPAPTGFFGGCQAGGCDDAVFLQQMAAAGAANYMDCVGVHYNEGIVPPTVTRGDPRSEYFTRYYPSMVNVYSGAFRGSRPLCFTELGYLTPEGLGPLPGGFAWASNVTVAQQAAWLRQVVDMARRSGNVRVLIIWNVDFTNYGDDPMAGYAIIRPDGSCPACDALGR